MENLDPKKVLASLTKNANKYCGCVNPLRLDDYLAFNGYVASQKVENGEVDVIEVLRNANLVARREFKQLIADKWAGADTVVCETYDPMSSLDAKLYSDAPHVIVEGIIISMTVNKASKGIIVAPDKRAYDRVATAIKAAKDAGITDKDIEVTMESAEGLKDNAQLLANVVVLVQDSYAEPVEKGLKGAAVGGCVANPGIYNVANGTTYRQLIEMAGGAKGNIKSIKMGAPYGEYIKADKLDEPVNFMSLMMNGMARGTALFVVIDDTVDMATEIANYLDYLLTVSCGKCFTCKVGTKRMSEIAKRIDANQASAEDPDLMNEIASNMNIATLCPIGQKGALTVLTAMENFGEDFRG